MPKPISRDEQIKNLKMCARSILENADDLIGNEAYRYDIKITINISPDGVPYIELHREFYPEELMNS